MRNNEIEDAESKEEMQWVAASARLTVNQAST